VTTPAVVVDHVSKRYRLYRERNQSLKSAVMRRGRARYDEFWALRDVSFEVPTGSTFGLIGENGSGKSTLLNCIARILMPDEGAVRAQGKVAALLELGSGFHPELSGRENIYLNGSVLGLSRRAVRSRFDDIVEFAGVGRFIDQPVKNYSSGMYVRLGFSVAINVDPDILVVDEILAVGDEAFQDKCMEKFADYRRAGKTVVIVSHAMASVRALCDQVAWLAHGRLVQLGPASRVVDEYVDSSHVAREGTLGSGRHWGSGEARLERVQMLDPSGRVTSRVRTGDPVTFRLHFVADQPVERPVFGVSVETLEGVRICALHSRDDGLDIDRIHGVGSIDLHVPAVQLQPGIFELNASIVDWSTTRTLDFHRHWLRFDVESGVPRESGGIVSLGGHFRPPVTVSALAEGTARPA
jgi:ABC-type polysaccharide/polyol phosphate transport system ATPase subunit